MNDALRSALKQLRLSGLLESLEVRLQEAAGHGLSHAEFLELILQDELAVRSDRQLQRRVKAALFRELKPLDQFDWSFNPSIKKKQVLDLATCRFVREKRDVLWLGPPGVGKSFLVQAIGYQAIKAGHAVLYRSIFDVVRDFLHDEALVGRGQGAVEVPQAGPADHRRHGDEAVAEAFGRVSLRDHHAAVRDAVDDDDLEPAAGGLGQAAGRRAHRDGDPGPVPAPRGGGPDQRPELPPEGPGGRVGGGVGGFKTSQSAPRLGGSRIGFKTSQSAPRLRRRPGEERLSRRPRRARGRRRGQAAGADESRLGRKKKAGRSPETLNRRLSRLESTSVSETPKSRGWF